MTQAYNLSQLANNLNTAGQLDATDGLVNAVPISNGGTGASTDSAARTNLGVPSLTGTGATGNWNINAATATTTTGFSSAGWTITEVSGQLLFKYAGVTKFTMDSTNGFIVA